MTIKELSAALKNSLMKIILHLHNQKEQHMMVDKEIIKELAKIKPERTLSIEAELDRQTHLWGRYEYGTSRNHRIKQYIDYYFKNVINNPASEFKSHPVYLKSKNIYAPLVQTLYNRYGIINYKEEFPEIDFDTPTKKATTTRNKRK